MLEQELRAHAEIVQVAAFEKIAIDFLLTAQKGRSRAWIPKKDNQVVGSVLIVERPQNQAQLRLLCADDSVRGVGLGRWLVEESVI